MVPPQQTNKGFHSQLFVVPKKDGGLRLYHQSKKIELFCGSCTLQNGGHIHAQGPPKRRGLDDKGRSKRCLFHDPHCTPSQTVTPFQMARTDLSIQLPAIRSVVHSMGLYQIPMPWRQMPSH